MATKMVVVFNNIPGLPGKLRERAQAAAQTAALLTEQEIKADMEQSKSGRTYKRGSKLHKASAAGESPAIDSGALYSSVQTDTDINSITAAVFTNAEQAEILEFGGVHMEPRPFMTPAVAKIRPVFFKLMKEVLK